MPLATVTGVRSSWEMFARKSAFADVPLATEARSPSSSSCRSCSLATSRATSVPNDVATTGDKTAAPVSAARMAASSASGPSSRSTYPAAPAAKASATTAASREDDRATTRVPGVEAQMRRMSSAPPTPPSPRSAVTTSGRERARGLDRPEGVGRHVDDEVGRLSQQQVLQVGHLVGGIAHEHRCTHLAGISAPRGGVEMWARRGMRPPRGGCLSARCRCGSRSRRPARGRWRRASRRFARGAS